MIESSIVASKYVESIAFKLPGSLWEFCSCTWSDHWESIYFENFATSQEKPAMGWDLLDGPLRVANSICDQHGAVSLAEYLDLTDRFVE